MQKKFRTVLQLPNKLHLEICQLQQIMIIHLFFDCISDFSLHDFILDEYLSDRLILLVEDIDLTGQTPVVPVTERNIDNRSTKAQRFQYLIFCEVDCLTFLETDKFDLERAVLFIEGKDECFLPDKVFFLCGGLAAPFSVVISKSTIDGVFLGDFFELSLPKSDDKFFLHNKYIDRPLIDSPRYLSNMTNVYQVEDILDEAIINNEPHYLIKWKNHGHESDTWEAISDLGNISDYLQHWLKKRRQNSANKKREHTEAAYQTIKPYLYRENLKPPKKTTRQKYAEEILKKKKTWEKYIDKDHQCIDLDSMEIQVPSNPKPLQKNVTSFYGNTHNCKKQEDEHNFQGVKLKQEFKVVGKIDTNEITRIIKAFVWKEIPCVEVELTSGRRFNMKQQELKRYQPLLLVQFYQNEHISF